MKPDLKKRIKEFNFIKFKSNKGKRIILYTLKPNTNSVTIAS